LTSITVGDNNQNYSSSIDGALFNKTKTKLIQFPCGKVGSYTIPNSVTSIFKYSFQFAKLTHVVIPNSVADIGEHAFSFSTLSFVAIGNSVTSIDKNAFRGCNALTSIAIPNSVTSIGDNAFGYSALGTVTIADGQIILGITFNSPITNPPGVSFFGATVNTVRP
jgi:hypothetical protein